MAFKDRLKEFRQFKKITQSELAKMIFVSRSAVAKWENGLGLPSDVNLKALCDFFGTEESRLLDRDDLKTEINGHKLQKRSVVTAVCGIVFPLVFAWFFVVKMFTFESPGVIFPAVYLPPRAAADFIGLAGECSALLLWGANIAFSAFCLWSVPLKRSAAALRVNIGLVAFSFVVFLVLIITAIVLAQGQNYRILIFC